MSELSLIGEVKDGVSLVLDSFKELLGYENSRDFNDIKKRAKENELTLYTLISDNVPSEIYARLANGIEAEVVSAINAIISSVVTFDANAAHKFIMNNFTNNQDIVSKIKTGVRDISDSLGENVDIKLSDIKITFSEADLNTKNDPKIIQGNAHFNRDIPNSGINTVTGNFHAAGITNNDLHVHERDALRVQGNYHTITITYADKQGVTRNIQITIFISVRIIPIESTKVIETIVSSRNRSNFYNYLRWRAGSTSFFKGFLLNLTEIEKQLKRDTSKDLAERMLGSLLTKSGFTQPKILERFTELKNFSLIISKDDADRLLTEHNMNVTKPSTLKQIFGNMNILSFVIVDTSKMRVMIFESDNPTEMSVISFADLNDATRLARLFQNINH